MAIRRLSVLVLAALASFKTAGQAAAQQQTTAQESAAPIMQFQHPPGFSDLFQPDFSRDDLPLFEKQFHLSDDQRVVIDSLIKDYQSAFNDSAQELRIALRDLEPDPELTAPEIREELAELSIALRRRMDELKQLKFAEDHEGADNRAEQDRVIEEVEQIRTRLQELSSPARNKAIAEVMGRFLKLTQRYESEQQAIRAQFVADVQAVLDEDQRERWPALERSVRRKRSLRHGRLSGESIDLFHVLDGLELEEKTRDEIAPLFEEYAVQLDQALVARDDWQKQAQRVKFEAVVAGQTRPVIAAVEREVRLRTVVRDLTLDYARTIAERLPDDIGKTFYEEVQRRAFRQVHRRSTADRAFAAALGLSNLDDDAASNIRELYTSFQREMDAMNSRIVASILRTEPRQLEQQLRTQIGLGSNEPAARRNPENGTEATSENGEPLQRAFQQRHQLEQQFLVRLSELLTPQQQGSIPGLSPRTPSPSDDESSQGSGFDQRNTDRDDLIAQYDRNGDGVLDEDEAAALQRALERERAKRRASAEGQ